MTIVNDTSLILYLQSRIESVSDDYESNLSLDFLKKDNENLSKNGQDSSEGIVPSKEFEEVSVNQNGDGTWSKSSVEKKSPVKKDITARSDEAKQYSEEVGALETYAKVSDNKIISIATQINEKKQLIVTKIAEAVSAGCSVGIGTSGVDAIVNGVTIGVGVTITDDYPFIKKYGGLDDPTAKVPFNSDDTVTLTTSNSGKGYFSGFTENGGEPIIVDAPLDGNVGIYRTVFDNPLVLPNPIGICTSVTEQVLILANEIYVLRSQIDSDLITKINTIKDRKTTSEVFVWGYASREHKVQDQIDINNTAINTIDKSSSIVSDLSGNGNDGTLYDVTSSRNGWVFDGTDDYISVDKTLVQGSELTMEVWFKTNKLSGKQHIIDQLPTIANFPSGDEPKRGAGMDITGSLTFRALYDGGAVTQVAVNAAISADTWHHAVGTISATDNRTKLFVDGILEDEDTTPFSLINDPSPFPFLIGAGFPLTLTTLENLNITDFFDGMIGEVRIYNRALTPTEITQNYNATKARYE
jgi:hypothetical protein